MADQVVQITTAVPAVVHTEITASEPDEESLTHTDDKNNLTSGLTARQKQSKEEVENSSSVLMDLPRQKSRSPVQKVSPFVSYLD